MFRTLRVRMVTAVLLALLLIAAAASPMASNIPGVGGTASADHCSGSTC